MGKNKINPDLKNKLAELKLSPQSFQTGGIYMTKDEKVLFPTRKNIEDKPRMVVVLGRQEELLDPMVPHVSAIPITTTIELETTQDLPVDKGTGNLDHDSLFKAGFLQPILKKDLGKHIGTVDRDQLDQLKATVIINLGIGEDDESEE